MGWWGGGLLEYRVYLSPYLQITIKVTFEVTFKVNETVGRQIATSAILFYVPISRYGDKHDLNFAMPEKSWMFPYTVKYLLKPS